MQMVYSLSLSLYIYLYISPFLFPAIIFCITIVSTPSSHQFLTIQTLYFVALSSHQLSLSPIPLSFFNHKPPGRLPPIINNQTFSRSSVSLIQIHNPKPIRLHSKLNPHFSTRNTQTVSEKLNFLVSKFKSLPEPIDRVKRLLHYANLLPEFDPRCRVKTNRVEGCTAQVWLEAKMDLTGAMRFKLDSDSEIMKGFCYCLIWLLDGATAKEVLELNIDDLGEINVGVIPIKVSSRVNTWHNVLIVMKKKTKSLIME